MTVTGIDISKWDGNWDALKAKFAGVEFVFIKSSQANFADKYFVDNWKKARDAKILRSAYHFLDYTCPARAQADFFADLLHGDAGELPPVVDFEQTRDDNNTTLARNYLKEFLEQMGVRGYNPIIYTSPGFWKTYGDNTNYWYQYPLWIANYTSAAAPIVPAPWLNWNFWQFSKNGPGTIFGSEALEIDVNRFNGTLSELHSFAGRRPETDMEQRLSILEARILALEKMIGQPPVPTPDPLPKATVIKSNAPVYDSPVSKTHPVGFLNLDQIVEIVESKSGWVRIKDPMGWMETASLKLPGNETGGNPVPVPAEYAVCSTSALNVRSGPDISFPAVGFIKMGQRVKILKRQNNWALLESPPGWSQGTYLTPA